MTRVTMSLRPNLLILTRIGYSHGFTANIRVGRSLSVTANIWLVTRRI